MLRPSAEGVVGVAVFGLSLFLYLFTMAPDLIWGDSGELAADVHTLGIPHPTGYPLYVLAGRVFSLTPVGSPAYRMNLFSGVCSALAVFVIFRTALRLLSSESGLIPDRSARKDPAGEDTASSEEPDRPREGKTAPGEENGAERKIPAGDLVAAAFAAMTLSVSPLFWSQATRTEVYAPAALLGAFLLFTGARCRTSGSRRSLEAFSLGIGLVFVHHLLALLLLPVAGYLAVPAIRRRARPAVIGKMLLFFVIGLSPALFLYLRGKADPVLNWGGVDSVRDVLWTMSGGSYGAGLTNPLPALFSFDPERLRGLGRYFSPWFKSALSQFGNLGLLAGVGIVSWWSRRGWFALVFFLALLAAIVVPACYQVGDRADFFYVLPLALSLPLAEGIRVFSRETKLGRERWFQRLGLALLFLCVLVVAVDSWKGADRSEDTGAAHYARGVFEIAKDARIIVTGIDVNQNSRDNEIHALWYGKYVLLDGDGPLILGANFLGQPWYEEMLRENGVPTPDWGKYIAAGGAVEGPDGTVLSTSRENWVEALAREILLPALARAPVYTTGRMPGPWQGIRFREAGRIPVDPAAADPLQRLLLPSGVVYRLEGPSRKEGP